MPGGEVILAGSSPTSVEPSSRSTSPIGHSACLIVFSFLFHGCDVRKGGNRLPAKTPGAVDSPILARRSNERRQAMSSTVKSVPEGYHTATPYLVVRGGSRAIDFYKKAFGAQERFRLARGANGAIAHAEFA